MISGKVSRSGEVEHHFRFDLDSAQWGGVGQKTVRITCYFPVSHPSLSTTLVPTVGKHISVQGVLCGIEDDRCVVYI